MKVCLFGGTFDPPHLGHLIIAQTIFEAEKFDQIVFVPAYKPPHTNGHQISPVYYPLDMLKIAIQENPNFILSDIKIQRKEHSFSSEWHKQFHSGKHPERLIKESISIVAIRPGFRPSDIPNWILSKIQFASIPRIEISSTAIRKRWIKDKTIRYMVTESVWQFINKNKLYL